MDVLEQRIARIGQQADRFFVGMPAGGELESASKAEEVAFLQVEQRAFVDQRMQQAAFHQEYLVGGQLAFQVVATFQFQGGAAGCQAFEQAVRDSLQAIDQLVGISRLLAE